MAARRCEPWSFEDGPVVADRILREYARWRLDSLPFLQDTTQRTTELAEGYRRLDDARVEAARKAHSVGGRRLATTDAGLRKEARIAWALWDVVHRHLVSIEFNRLQTACVAADDLRLTLIAEQQVEALLRDR